MRCSVKVTLGRVEVQRGEVWRWYSTVMFRHREAASGNGNVGRSLAMCWCSYVEQRKGKTTQGAALCRHGEVQHRFGRVRPSAAKVKQSIVLSWQSSAAYRGAT